MNCKYLTPILSSVCNDKLKTFENQTIKLTPNLWDRENLQATLGLALLGLDLVNLNICNFILLLSQQDVINLAYE
jgi:hypothetical protein